MGGGGAATAAHQEQNLTPVASEEVFSQQAAGRIPGAAPCEGKGITAMTFPHSRRFHAVWAEPAAAANWPAAKSPAGGVRVGRSGRRR